MSKNFMARQYPSLTAVAHAAVKAAPSGLQARTIADTVGKPYNTLMSELSGQDGHKLGADLLLPIMEATDSHAPLEFLARERGGLFIPVPDPAESAACMVTALARSITGAAMFFHESAKAIEDGRVEARELAAVESVGFSAMAAIMGLIKLARVTHREQYGAR